MNTTRKASSIETALAALYCGLKIYMLNWAGVSYTAFFWTQSIFTMVADVVAIVFSFRLRLVSTLVFAGVILVDLLVVLGATRAISFFEHAEQTVQSAIQSPPGVGRHLLVVTTPPWTQPVAVDALGNAVNALALPVTAMPGDAKSALQKATGLMQSFVLGVAQACQAAHEQAPGFACTDTMSSAKAALTLLETTPCCDVNSDYLKTVNNVAKVLSDLNERWSTMWTVEGVTFAGEYETSAQLQAKAAAVAQAAAVPATPKEWKSFWQNVSRAITGFWNSLVGKNVKNSQSPWVTSSGEKVPSPVWWAWVVVHCICIGLVIYQIIGTLTRSHKLPGLFGSKRLPAENRAADDDMAVEGASHGGVYDAYFGSARRRKKTGGAASSLP